MPKSAKPRKEYNSNSKMPPPKIEEKLTPQEIVKRSMERMDPALIGKMYIHMYTPLLNQINLERFDMEKLFYFFKYKAL
jgi:hypothetical protein